ncbi:CPBP family intramembrane glutamic endopeptidase [Streptococcus oricebi]|uniref:CPBP family intramembrane metalloprotease n=1 Tax=Streptococcus oricebi TaxID=1547447 RepID=A0ABS5B0P9_9STRE|nr:type II CAAX endopeptidase family protein [Streptococcus oricebi]MBP2622408.1 CPBP family intramembrane metalloprotease [Streptococcus oricebi]
MFKQFKLNTSMLAIKAKKLGWRPFVVCYLLYALVMSLTRPWLISTFQLGKLWSILGAYFITCLVCLAFITSLGHYSFKDLGLEKSKFGKNVLQGWLYASLILGLIFLANLATGAIHVNLNPQFQPLLFLLLLVGFSVQSFMEEFLFRGLIFTNLAIQIGPGLAILINSLLFALGHASNASASPLSVINTFLIGFLFSLIAYYHDNLWLAAAFHAGWNFLLGPVLGSEVSGFELPTSWLKISLPDKLQLLNGGAYGFEASILVSVLILIFIVYYLQAIKKSSLIK